MDSREDLAAALPAPQDDEPTHLRQDIVDELADHLACAMQQALAAAPNEQIARDRVRARFGDPQRIAIQLYWDALWEKVMLKRIHLGVTIFLAVALLATCGLLWQSVVQGQHLALEMQRAANDRLAQQLMEANQRLAKERLTGQVQLKTPEWNAVKLRLVQGAPGGPPAPGFKINAQGEAARGANAFAYHVDLTSDSDGRADLGLVQPGNYVVHIMTPWNETASTTFFVAPGREVELEFACPATPVPSASVDFHVDWPVEWQDRDIYLGYEIIRPGRKIGDLFWGESPRPQAQFLACRQNARKELEWVRGKWNGTPEGMGNSFFWLTEENAGRLQRTDDSFDRVLEIPALQEVIFGSSRQRVEGYPIRIVRICALQRLVAQESTDGKHPDQFMYLAGMAAQFEGDLATAREARLTVTLPQIDFMESGLRSHAAGSHVSPSASPPAGSFWEFVPGSDPTWKLPLPQAILNQVREQLNEKSKPESAKATQQ